MLKLAGSALTRWNLLADLLLLSVLQHLPMPRSWVSTDRLGLDVHHVITVEAPKGTPSYQCVDKGAYTFIVLYKLIYGLGELYLCSRINSPSLEWVSKYGSECKHFVLRLIEDIGLLDMGLPRDNIDSCQVVSEKGSFAKRHELRCFVDDRFDCLAGIHRVSPYTEWLVQYTNDPMFNGKLRADKACRRSSDFNAIYKRVWVMSDWRELAEWCGLPTDDAIWSWLGDRLPPAHDYDPGVLEHCRELFFPAPKRQLTATPKRQSSPEPKSKAMPGSARKNNIPSQPDYPPPSHPTEPSSGSAEHPKPKWGARLSSSSNPYVHEALDGAALTLPESQERMLHSAVSAMLDYGSDVQINISHSGSVSVSTQPAQLQLATRWTSSTGSKWHECKRLRAEKHRAAKQARLDAGLPAEYTGTDEPSRLPMCVICQACQRALRCNHKCCVHCCVRAFDDCTSLEHGVTRSQNVLPQSSSSVS